MKKSIISLFVSTILLAGCGSNEIITTAVPNPVQNIVTETQSNPMVTDYQKNINTNEVKTATKILPAAKNIQTNNLPTQKRVSLTPDLKKTQNQVQVTPVKKVNIAENYNTESILVGIKSAEDLKKANELALKYNLKVSNIIKGINTIVFSTNGQKVPDLLHKLAEESIVSFAETDNVSTNKPEKETDVIDSLFNILATGPVNDKYFKDQYGLNALHVPEAWALSTGKKSIISVIDSGVDVNHEDLKMNVVPGYDAFSKEEGIKAANASRLNYISLVYKHGSHVAGIAAAQYNNGKGIAGVAPEAKILPVKIFPDFTDYFKTVKKNDDGSDVTVVSAIADGIVYSVDHHADVINMSLGVWAQSITLENAVKYALDHNVSVVVAAGNERNSGNQRNYLAAINGVIAVGATDQDNKITYFSNSGDYVSVAAPGWDVTSSVPSFLSLRSYRKMSGTSMAAPAVAGVVALLKDKFGAVATPQWIKQRLESTATDLGTSGRDDLYGHGLVNAFKALNDPV